MSLYQSPHIPPKLPWWREPFPVPDSLRGIHIVYCVECIRVAGPYLRLWRFELEPEFYFDPSLSSFQHAILGLLLHPALQFGLGILALAAMVIFMFSASYKRLLLAWAIGGFAWIVNYAYQAVLYKSWLLLGLIVAAPLAFFPYWHRSVKLLRKVGYEAPIDANWRRHPAFVYALFTPIVWLSFSDFLEPRSLPSSAPFIGQRMINGRGAWLVEDFEFQGAKRPFPAKRIFFHRDGYCKLEKPSRSGFGSFHARKDTAFVGCFGMASHEFDYRLQGDKLHLNAPGFSLTLRQDNWGPGYYDDIFPFLRK